MSKLRVVSDEKSCHTQRRRVSSVPPLDLAAVRSRLAKARGPEFWRSLEELAGDPRFEEMVHREFPRQASEWIDSDAGGDGVSRRNFLQLASASLALAGLTACTKQPMERIVPYVKQPEELVPGKPLFYATAVTTMGYAAPVLIETHMGRPTKVEGNPDHPWSLGGSDAFTQASILTLYDPDRAQTITNLGAIRTWKAFIDALAPMMAAQAAIGGEGLRILTPTITSPTLAALLRALLEAHPKAVWHQWDAAGGDAVRAGAKMAFGDYVDTRYDLEKADVIVALDSDFLTQGIGAVRYARQFADRRRLRGATPAETRPAMNRFYAVESTPTATGTNADHRWALAPAEIAQCALGLAAALGVGGAVAPDQPSGAAPEFSRFLPILARDLRAHAGRSLFVVGETCDPALHALGHGINAALGNVGATVFHSAPVEAVPTDQMESLRALVAALNSGSVDLLVIIGGNPVYDAPSDFEFSTAIQKATLRVHSGLYADETAQYCHWQIPQAHDFESWGDARAVDGTATIQQPLIEPLYNGKSAIELIAALAGGGDAKGMDLVRQHWQAQGLDDAAWRKALHDGMVANTAAIPSSRTAGAAGAADPRREIASVPMRLPEDRAADASAAATIPVLFKPDPTLHDGRFANNAWLQECPKPLTKLTWDNALLVAPRTAERLGLRHEELASVVDSTSGGTRQVSVPVWVMPGHAENCATLHLGHGRSTAGRVGNGVGTNVYPLRASRTPWLVAAEVSGRGEIHPLSSTQMHSNIELEGEEAQKRHLVRTATLAEYVREPGLIREMGETPDKSLTLYPKVEYKGYAWGMAIDLNACTGCNACVVACQSENNIATVGKEQVRRGREMHWIRIDRYYGGELDAPLTLHQPVLCMQCENAPCETVCPVAATVHSSEGLNDMVYNRCVGTRYCSNNCPYKVRRFNFLNHAGNVYNDARSNPVLELLRNPDVTVRSRGVMEKCTYCVQRINRAKIEAEVADRKVRDGEIQTACQQACPSRAIVFGDINDPAAEVSAWKSEPRNYGLIEELNTRPRTTYLARITNPNPELDAPAGREAAGAAMGSR